MMKRSRPRGRMNNDALSASSPSWNLFPDSETAENRLATAVQCAGALKSYQDFLQSLRENSSLMESGSRSSQLAAARAYEAEKYLRVLLKLGLDNLNDLRDSGVIPEIFPQNTKTNGKSLKATFESFKKSRPANAMESAILDEIVNMFIEHKIAIETKDGNVLTEIDIPNMGIIKTSSSLHTPVGGLGRIDSNDLFGVGAYRVQSTVARALGRWRRRGERATKRSPASSSSIQFNDLYALFVGNLASARDMIYVHARDVERFGPGGMRGNVVGIAILIALLVAAVISLLVAGISGIICAAGNKEACNVAAVAAEIGAGLAGGIGGIALAIVASSGSSSSGNQGVGTSSQGLLVMGTQGT